MHVHHKIPQSLGGLDTPENLVELCNGCHLNLHQIAYMFANPRRHQEVEPTAISIFPDNYAARKRLLELAGLVAREMALKRETKKELDDDVRTVVELPMLYKQLLKLLSFQRLNSLGKPMGLGNLVKNIVADELKRHFPLKSAEIDRMRKKKKADN